MKSVFIHAYLADNFGDDLFVALLCKRYPKTHFRVLSDNSYREKFSELKNLTVYTADAPYVKRIDHWLQKMGISRGFWKILVRTSRAVIHIGGSSFVQHFDDWSAFYGTDLYLAEKSKGLYLIGSNFGPFTDPGYLLAYKQLFSRYKGICFRDHDSWQLFSDIAHTACAPDVVFNLVPGETEKKKKALIVPIALENRTGKYDISRFSDSYFRFHLRGIRYLLQQGYQVTLCSFCAPQGDAAMIQRLLSSLSASEAGSVRHLPYHQNMPEIIREFQESSFVLGTRFHSIILGLLCGCRVFPIIYNQKTEQTLRDLHLPERFQLSELDNIPEDQIETSSVSLSRSDIERLRREAEKQFQFTDRLLK